MAQAVAEPLTGPQALEAYFAERERYLEQHPVAVSQGAMELLHCLRGLGVVRPGTRPRAPCA